MWAVLARSGLLLLVMPAAAASADTMVAPTVPAAATDPPAPVAAPAPPPEVSAADVRGAPPPGAESGRTDDVDDGESAIRAMGRGALFVPKLAFELGMAPIRGTVWADNRYHLEDRYYQVFFSADRTIRLYPTAMYTSGFGAVAGLRFDDRDVLGKHESIALTAMTGAVTGDTYRADLLASVRSGDRVSRWLRLGVDASFDRRSSIRSTASATETSRRTPARSSIR